LDNGAQLDSQGTFMRANRLSKYLGNRRAGWGALAIVSAAICLSLVYATRSTAWMHEARAEPAAVPTGGSGVLYIGDQFRQAEDQLNTLAPSEPIATF
jgi:hypothetical protein